MSSQGKKRAGSSSTNSGRQGSSFWTCPACGTSVHGALMAFHLSSCPVVISNDKDPIKKNKRRQPQPPITEESGERTAYPRSGSPEFTLVPSQGKKKMHKEPQQTGGTPSTLDSFGEKLCADPETPIQEGRDRIPFRLQITSESPSPSLAVGGTKRDGAEARKRLFEDWGQKLSPEPELVVPSIPNDNAAASLVGSQPKRARLAENSKTAAPGEELNMIVDLGVLDAGSEDDISELESLPYGNTVRDSQQQQLEDQEVEEEVEEVEEAFDHIEKIAQELGTTVESQQMQGDGDGSLEKASEFQDGKRVGNCVSRRELELECALRELREKYSLLLRRETDLERALKAKNKECEEACSREAELERSLQAKNKECEEACRRDQEARNKLGLLETALQKLRKLVRRKDQKEVNEIQKPERKQSHSEEDEEVDVQTTQLLSPNLDPPASCSSSPKRVQDEFLTVRADSENLMMEKKLSDRDEEQGTPVTQVLSQGFSLPNSDQYPQPSAVHPQSLPVDVELRRVSSSEIQPLDKPRGDSSVSPTNTLDKVDKCRGRRLFDRVTGMAGVVQSAEDNAAIRLLQSSGKAAASGLAPQTPGNLALKPAYEHEMTEGHEGDEWKTIATSKSVDPEETGSTPGGPKTPQNLAMMVGVMEKGLISDLLDSFPPAQGTETQSGVDPFDDNVLQPVNKIVLNVSAVPHTDKQVDHKLSYSDGQGSQKIDTTDSHVQSIPEVLQSSEDSEEVTLVEMRLRKKRKKPALVIESDSDLDIGNEEVVHDMSGMPLTKANEDSARSGLKVGRSNLASEKDYGSPDPVMNAFRGDRSSDTRLLSSPSTSALFQTEGKKPRHTNSFGDSPDLIINASSPDNNVISPPLLNVMLSSEGQENMCAGSQGSGRKGKHRRLVRVQQSLSADCAEGLQPGLEAEGTKDTGTKVLRRSGRLRNLSMSKQTTLLSEDHKERDPNVRRSKRLAKTGHGTSSKDHVLEDDEETPETDSDSSDVQPIEVLQRCRKSGTAKSKRNSEVPRDPYGNKLEVDDDDGEDGVDDDDSFINDDPELDVDSGSATAGEESSESDEEIDSDGSESSRGSSDEQKKVNWELEGDMLASLAKDTDLCLRGLCALYRRQEDDEQRESSSKYRNKRGFDKFHATKASNIASFLIGSPDSSGPVIKTSAELENHFGVDAVTFCSDMCIHHSKQLFEIFQNKEDPYFPA